MTKSKKYYYDLFNKEIDKIKLLKKKPKLLLHACCAPCSSATIIRLIDYFEVAILYYNPNIYPESEFAKRYDEVKRLVKDMQLKIEVISIGYNPEEYFAAVKGKEKLGERSLRCQECFRLRLYNTANYAKEHGYDYFTTTLTISSHKDAEMINEVMKEASVKYDIKYLPCDFKKDNGYKESIALSHKYNLYRQDYCGCVFSYQERKDRQKDN